MPDWALAVTASNCERIVSADFRRFNYDHILFKRHRSRVHLGRVVDEFVPAFPRYIFIGLEHCWDAVRDIARVLGLVSFGEELGVVPARVVETLVARCGGGDCFPREPAPEPFRRGDRVRVGGIGPASGHEAVYEALADDGKVRLHFDWLGRLVPIDIDTRDVSLLTARPITRKRRRRRRSHATRSLSR
jgi:transcription antitermination factor NusG